MNVFLDTSALMKRYVEEPGSEALAQVFLLATAIAVSELCALEVVSGLNRRRRQGLINQAQYGEAKQELLLDVSGMSVLAASVPIIDRAVELLERWPLRASDSLHVASALEWAAERFVSADRRQCEAARGEGLAVEDLGRV